MSKNDDDDFLSLLETVALLDSAPAGLDWASAEGDEDVTVLVGVSGVGVFVTNSVCGVPVMVKYETVTSGDTEAVVVEVVEDVVAEDELVSLDDDVGGKVVDDDEGCKVPLGRPNRM